MPFKNFYFKDENFLLTVFYGVITNIDMRNHAIEMLNQDILTTGFSKIVNGKFIKAVDINTSNIRATVDIMSKGEAVKYKKCFMIAKSPKVKIIADRYADEWAKHDEEVVVISDIKDALKDFSKEHLLDDLTQLIEKYEGFGEGELVDDDIFNCNR